MDSERDSLSSLWSPQEADILQAKESRAGHFQRLADVREQIRRLQEEKITLERELKDYDVLLAPIRRIPNDILREIFARTLPTVVSITPSGAPVLLTHVCRRWRQVAIDFVGLWRRLSINCCQSTGGTHAAGELMRRSAGVGRSILTSAAPMLTRLALYRIPLTLLTFPQPDLFPCLERLIMSPEEDLPTENMSIQAFMNAPRLRYVSMYDWEYLITSGKVQMFLPWQQLTHFLYTGDSVASHLPLCSKLVYLGIELNVTQPDPDPWGQLPLGQCLALLEGLCIHFPRAFYHPIEFFETYRVPNLTSLRLEIECLMYDPEICHYLQTTMSHATHLTRLSLRCDDWTLHGIHTLLEGVPTIQILDVQLPLFDDYGCENDWDGFFQALEWIDHDPRHHLLPQLHTLILRPTGVTNEEHEHTSKPFTINPHFLTVISSRMARPLDQRIRRIVAYLSEPLDRELIQQYINDGLVYEEYPVGHKEGRSDIWMDDDPALSDWPELQWS